MNDIKTPKGRLVFPGLSKPAMSEKLVSLEEAMADWRRVALTCQPHLNADYIRTVCEEIVRRAQILAETSPLEFGKVAAFLLTRTRAWVLGGLPVGDIGGKLPKTLGDLGMMKIAEGGEDGEPLSGDELKRALKGPKKRIIH